MRRQASEHTASLRACVSHVLKYALRHLDAAGLRSSGGRGAGRAVGGGRRELCGLSLCRRYMNVYIHKYIHTYIEFVVSGCVDGICMHTVAV